MTTKVSRKLSQRIEAFFRENPDEELTVADAVVKFDRNEAAIVCCVRDLRRQGVLEGVRVIRRRPAGPAPAAGDDL